MEILLNGILILQKKFGLENEIPYEDDLYLDYVIEPNGSEHVLDEDELLDALNCKKITKKEYEMAYATLKFLKGKFFCNLDYLNELSNNFRKEFK